MIAGRPTGHASWLPSTMVGEGMENNLSTAGLTDQNVLAGTLPRSAARIVLFSCLTALAAQIRVPLPFTPVPMTFQLVPVLLAGAFLGARGAAFSQIILIVAGLAGAPVFAGGSFGPAHLLGPTGGYLLGFAGAAWLVGRLLHGPVRLGYAGVLASMLAGAALVHFFGTLNLMIFMGGNASLAFELGSLPFLIGDLLKAVLAASIFAAWSARRRE